MVDVFPVSTCMNRTGKAPSAQAQPVSGSTCQFLRWAYHNHPVSRPNMTRLSCHRSRHPRRQVTPAEPAGSPSRRPLPLRSVVELGGRRPPRRRTEHGHGRRRSGRLAQVPGTRRGRQRGRRADRRGDGTRLYGEPRQDRRPAAPRRPPARARQRPRSLRCHDRRRFTSRPARSGPARSRCHDETAASPAKFSERQVAIATRSSLPCASHLQSPPRGHGAPPDFAGGDWA